MTDKFNALTVVLAEDISDDDAQALIAAIKQLRGVLTVSGNVSDIHSHVAEARARQKIGDAVWKAIYGAQP
jgi:inosine-uridine nucleoside N-ribohydrolase